MNHFAGIPIIESDRLPEFTPVLQLSNKVTVSDEFRKKTNEWYLEFFGQKRTMIMISGKYVAHPNTIRILMEQLK